jgi:hypothetical protein
MNSEHAKLYKGNEVLVHKRRILYTVADDHKGLGQQSRLLNFVYGISGQNLACLNQYSTCQ